MRVLFLSSVFPKAHAPTRGIYCRLLCDALATRHEVRVISPTAWTESIRFGGTSDRPPNEVYPTYYFPPRLWPSRAEWFMWRSIRTVVHRVGAEFRPECVLSYWAHPDGAVAVKGARLWGVPAGVIVGGSDILILPRSPARRRAVVAALSAADAVFAVGRALCEATVALGIDPDKVHLHRQGIDPRFRPADRAAARRRLGLPLDTDILLWVGRMVPVKGLDVLIDACARLRKSGREFRLVLAGDGPLRSAVAADCERRHLTRLVLFVGPQPHDALPDWYRAADLCVLSSYSEGVPNVLRESLACGTPYVATAVGGVAEITDDPAVRLVPPNDPAALASAIDRALSERLAPVADSARFPDWCEAAERMIEVLMTRRCQSSEPSYQLEPCA